MKSSEGWRKHWGCATFFDVLRIQNVVKRVDKDTRYCILGIVAKRKTRQSIQKCKLGKKEGKILCSHKQSSILLREIRRTKGGLYEDY